MLIILTLLFLLVPLNICSEEFYYNYNYGNFKRYSLLFENKKGNIVSLDLGISRNTISKEESKEKRIDPNQLLFNDPVTLYTVWKKEQKERSFFLSLMFWDDVVRFRYLKILESVFYFGLGILYNSTVITIDNNLKIKSDNSELANINYNSFHFKDNFFVAGGIMIITFIDISSDIKPIISTVMQINHNIIFYGVGLGMGF